MVNDLLTLIDIYKVRLDRVDEMKAKLKEESEQLDKAKEDLAQAMANEEVQNIARHGFSYSLVSKTKYSKKAGADAEFFEALEHNGLGDLIQPSVNAMRLNSALNELVENNDGELPQEFQNVVNTYSFLDISKRKKV